MPKSGLGCLDVGYCLFDFVLTRQMDEKRLAKCGLNPFLFASSPWVQNTELLHEKIKTVPLQTEAEYSGIGGSLLVSGVECRVQGVAFIGKLVS